MKKLAIAIITLTIGFVSMSFINNTVSISSEVNKAMITTENGNPDNEAKAIIENKCYGCHNSESKNKKGRKKLSFDTMDELSVYKQIGKYEGIHETILESEMPPKKFLAKYPDKALTSNEKEVLIAWAKAKGEELTK
ncbi:MAG: heme-binding domain-containing protein [Flavobacteriales bacterium]|nr:heme-binding domain-containing protein [Flavobacteriales bacterium]